VEGHFVGQVLGIRAWCSIPGLIGLLLDRDYLTETVSTPANRDALAAIERKYGVSVRPDQVELISNSLHLPAELNLLWSYPAVTPSDFLTNRQPARYQFAGYLTGGHPGPRRRSGPPLLYLSFGTEVMDNLWHAEQQTRDGIRRCVAGLARRWSSPDIEVVFSTLDRFVLADYLANWQVHPKVDQQQVLSRADVFVTHGGSNSLHEAVLHQVPTVVVPFFGDQMLIGQRVEELGIGIALGTADGVDNRRLSQAARRRAALVHGPVSAGTACSPRTRHCRSSRRWRTARYGCSPGCRPPATTTSATRNPGRSRTSCAAAS
jgi:hypothetical protein